MPTPKTKKSSVPSAIEQPRVKATHKGTYPNPAYGLTLVILLLTTALLLGGASVFWRASIVDQVNRQVDARYMKLMLEASSQTPDGQATSTVSGEHEADMDAQGRIELTAAEAHQAFNPLTDSLNTSAATTTVEFSATDKGLASIDLPYSPLWGNEKFALQPYETTQEGAIFGPLIKVGAMQGEVLRTMSLTTIPPRSSSAAMRAAASEGTTTPILRVFPSVTYVKYANEDQPGGQVVVEIIGTQANYRLTSFGLGDLPDLERIARSIEFTK